MQERDYKRRYRLMCPGPVNVSPRILQAMAECEIGHREHEFSELLEELRARLLWLLGLDASNYANVVITGSGSAANEAVLCSAISEEDSVLSLSTGEFGRRLAEISSIYNPRTIHHEQPWATSLDLAAVEAQLKARRIDWVTMVHHETSTGELQPVEEVGHLCARYGAKLFVDAVSSFMSDPLDLKACQVTMMSTSSGKALGMPPGLGLVVGLRSEFERLQGLKIRNYYLNLARHYDYYERLRQTPNTPSIALFIALNEALRMLCEEGTEKRFREQAERAAHLRAGLESLGLSLWRPEARLSNAVSSVVLPRGVVFEDLRAYLRLAGIIVYSGKGPLLNQIFQVSTLGQVSKGDIDIFLAQLGSYLETRSGLAAACVSF